MTEDRRLADLVLYAWVGEDEYGSGEVGLKRGLTSVGPLVGDTPLVALAREKVDRPRFREALDRQGRAFRKRIRLCRFVFAEELDAVGEPETGDDRGPANIDVEPPCS